jgi:PAS domain S-box-containing protein
VRDAPPSSIDSSHAVQPELAELASLQEALAREAQRYREMFESAPLAFLTTDGAGKVLEANLVSADMLGIDRGFLIGKPLTSFVAPGERRRFRTWMADVQLRGVPASIHVRFERRSGVTLDAYARATPFAEEIWWSLVDVSEQRRAEELVWELHREIDTRVTTQIGLMQALYDEISVGIVIVEARTRRVQSKNLRAREILEPWDGLLPGFETPAPDDDDPDPWCVSQALTGRRSDRELRRVLAADGRDVPLAFTSIPLRDDTGSVVAAAITIDNLSDRERRELADAQFVENAAHQLRTPITAIAIAAAALAAGAKDSVEERERFVAHITRESDRMVRVIDALLGLARIQRGAAGLLVAIVPLRPMLDNILVESTFRDGVQVLLDCPDDVAAVGDAAILREAFANVLRNAAWHTRAGTVRVHARLAGESTVLEISDSGPGVPPAVRDRIFERFFHGDGSSRGAGLGLALALEAAHANHGSLELLETDEGAAFRFTLPGCRLL